MTTAQSVTPSPRAAIGERRHGSALLVDDEHQAVQVCARVGQAADGVGAQAVDAGAVDEGAR
jgi:hypothetical protein